MTTLEKLEAGVRAALNRALQTQSVRTTFARVLQAQNPGQQISDSTVSNSIRTGIDAALTANRKALAVVAEGIDEIGFTIGEISSRVDELEKLFAGKLSGSEAGLRDSTRRYLAQIKALEAEVNRIEAEFKSGSKSGLSDARIAQIASEARRRPSLAEIISSADRF